MTRTPHPTPRYRRTHIETGATYESEFNPFQVEMLDDYRNYKSEAALIAACKHTVWRWNRNLPSTWHYEFLG